VTMDEQHQNEPRGRKWKWSLGTLLWLTAVVAAYMAGRNSGRKLQVEPVVVVARHLSQRQYLSNDDFVIENRLASSVPENATRSIDQLEGKVLLHSMEPGAMVTGSDWAQQTELITFSLAPGHKVINVRLAQDVDPLIYWLLDAKDLVQLASDSNDGQFESFTGPVQVFDIQRETGIVLLLVDEPTAEQIVAQRKAGREIRLVPPGSE